VAGVVAATFLFPRQEGDFWATVFGYPLLSASMGLIVAAGSEPSSLIGRRAIPGAGALAAGAYSLYLSHKMLFGEIGRIAPHADPLLRAFALPIAFASAFVLAAALYWGVERPFLKLRDRLGGPTRTPIVAEPAAA
jgi:peptidoglycan/LPS O-acetylase OafA/YrhL